MSVQKRENETVVENRKLDYELLRSVDQVHGEAHRQVQVQGAWQAMMKRTAHPAQAAGVEETRGGARGQQTGGGGGAERRRATPESRNAEPAPGGGAPGGIVGAMAAADAAAAAGGGGNAEVKKLADEFQEQVIRVMLARKELQEENDIIIAKSLEGTKKKKRANKPNEFITNDDFCPNCGLRLKNMSGGRQQFLDRRSSSANCAIPTIRRR